jgi:Uma2 family endonuclease
MTQIEPLNIVRPLPLRVEDFLLLDDGGAFADYGKTELIDGAVVFINAQHRPHARIKMHLYNALRDTLKRTGSPYTVFAEATISMPPHNAPEPDLVLTNEPNGEGPIPLMSVALVAEVADATLANDLGTKARIYGQNGIAEYWVADVQDRVIYQHTQPSVDGYAKRVQHPFGADLASVALPGLTISTADLR